MMRMTRRMRGVLGVGLLLLVAACAQNHGMGSTNPLAPDSGGSAASGAPMPAALTGTWTLVSLQEAGRPATSIGSPERFTAEFASDGRVSLRADCNRCNGTCAATDGALRVSPMACTRAYCSSAPLDTQFAGLVGASTSWTVSGRGLELTGASGTLQLRR